MKNKWEKMIFLFFHITLLIIIYKFVRKSHIANHIYIRVIQLINFYNLLN